MTQRYDDNNRWELLERISLVCCVVPVGLLVLAAGVTQIWHFLFAPADWLSLVLFVVLVAAARGVYGRDALCNTTFSTVFNSAMLVLVAWLMYRTASSAWGCSAGYTWFWTLLPTGLILALIAIDLATNVAMNRQQARTSRADATADDFFSSGPK